MIKEDIRYGEGAVMEGMISFRAVIAGIETGVTDRTVLRVMFDGARKSALRRHLSYVRAMSEKYRFSMEEVSAEEIASHAIGSSHGGLLTFVSPRRLPDISEIALSSGFYVMLNGIEDPYNFGYALRSLYAAGVDGVVLGKRNWMTAAGVVCRSSAGASERLPLYLSEDDETVARLFHEAGFRIVSADMEHSRPAAKANLKKPLLLVVGGEKRGLSEAIKKVSDETVRIEYGRPFGEALSAASAASILSFFVLEQNRS